MKLKSTLFILLAVAGVTLSLPSFAQSQNTSSTQSRAQTQEDIDRMKEGICHENYQTTRAALASFNLNADCHDPVNVGLVNS